MPGSVNVSLVQGYSNSILTVINQSLVPVLFAIAFIMFLWGVYKYFIIGATEDKKREEGRHFVLWSIIGFAVILSVWGLVAVVTSTFNLPAGATPPSYPKL